MLLNKIPVLDKGYVALLDSCNTTSKLRDMGTEFFGGQYPVTLEELGSMTVAIKCPLFFQLYLSKFSLKVINAATQGPTEYYSPHAGDVGAHDVTTSEAIADDLARTAAALIINPAAYQADGCDRFVSQINTPLSVYTTLIVQGEYSEWSKIISSKSLPAPIQAFTTILEQIITAEWK